MPNVLAGFKGLNHQKHARQITLREKKRITGRNFSMLRDTSRRSSQRGEHYRKSIIGLPLIGNRLCQSNLRSPPCTTMGSDVSSPAAVT